MVPSPHVSGVALQWGDLFLHQLWSGAEQEPLCKGKNLFMEALDLVEQSSTGSVSFPPLCVPLAHLPLAPECLLPASPVPHLLQLSAAVENQCLPGVSPALVGAGLDLVLVHQWGSQ